MSTVSKFALLGLHIYVSVRYVRMDVSLWVRLVCGSIGDTTSCYVLVLCSCVV